MRAVEAERSKKVKKDVQQIGPPFQVRNRSVSMQPLRLFVGDEIWRFRTNG